MKLVLCVFMFVTIPVFLGVTGCFIEQYNSNLVSHKPKINKETCSYNGIPLKGMVKVVEHFADFKVQIVTSFPDIDVKTVSVFPNNCGEWQFVEHFPDFTIQYVSSFPDFTVRMVKHFPGVK